MARTKRTVRMIEQALDSSSPSSSSSSLDIFPFPPSPDEQTLTPPPPPMEEPALSSSGRPIRRVKRPARLSLAAVVESNSGPPSPAVDEAEAHGHRVKRANGETQPFAPQRLDVSRVEVLTLSSAQMDRRIEEHLSRLRGRPSDELRREIARVRRLVSNRESAAQSRERRSQVLREMAQRIASLEAENARLRGFYSVLDIFE